MPSARQPRDWHEFSTLNMTQAMKVQRGASQQQDASRKAHHACFADNVLQYSGLQTSLEKKVDDSKGLLDMLQSRIRSVQHSIHQSKSSLTELQASLRATDAPLRLCEYRMAQREKKPSQERVRDPFETALEEEKDTLLNAQKQLKDDIKRTQVAIEKLLQVLAEMEDDSRRKSEAKNIDEICLTTTHKLWQDSLDRDCQAKLQLDRSHPIAFAGLANEDRRQESARKLNSSSSDKERHAQAVRQEAAQLMHKCDLAIDTARTRTERAMQERIKEIHTMRKKLENEIQDTITKIDGVKATNSETKHELHALGQPNRLASTRGCWRSQRPQPELINDPVSTHLAEHQAALTRTTKELKKRADAEKSTIRELTQQHDQLRADLKDKMESLQIDENCKSAGKVVRPYSESKTSHTVVSSFSSMGSATGALIMR